LPLCADAHGACLPRICAPLSWRPKPRPRLISMTKRREQNVTEIPTPRRRSHSGSSTAFRIQKTLSVEHTNFQGLLFSRVTFAMTYMSCFDDILPQGRRQVKTCGVDRHGERGARAYNGIWRRSDPPTPPLCKNSSDLYQFQERPLAKVGWTCPPRACTGDRRHCIALVDCCRQS